MSKIYPVIMCGGSGTRLWPVSTKSSPKQYQPIVTERSMLRETIARFAGNRQLDCADPSFVAALDHAPMIESACTAEDLTPHQILLEPCARNTAAVAASIALSMAQTDPNALILLLPADHHIDDVPGFHSAIQTAIPAAQNGKLVTFGIQATGPETGYGYIQLGAETDKNTFDVRQFVEKPDLDTAKSYLQSGDYFWNAGIFLFTAEAMISAFEAHAPQILEMSQQALTHAKTDGARIYLDPASFAKCESDSIDYAIMEKADNVQIIAPVDIGWSDIGSWDALRERALAEGKLTQGTGEIVQIGGQNTFIRSDGPMVAAIGVDDLIIVAIDKAVLVSKAGESQRVKDVVDTLKSRSKDDLI